MKKTIEITQTVEVEIPDGFFTNQFMEIYRQYFYNFTTPEEHYKYLAQLHARGIVDDFSFIEGYGLARELGIKFNVTDISTREDAGNA